MRYAKTNCFIHQLLKSLKYVDPKIKFYDWGKISFSRKINLIRNHDLIIIIFRQRILFNELEQLKSAIRDTPIVVYDQDPWNAYWDEYHTKGIYLTLNQEFNLKSLALPSKWWCDYVSLNDHVPTKFVRMGMLPEYCTVGIKHNERSIKGLSFKGTLYEHRIKTFKYLLENKIYINYETNNLNYHDFLDYLTDISIFFHDEAAPIMCNGVAIPRNLGMWHKDIEIAARGCFIIRDYSVESESYDINEIPSIFMYNEIDEVPKIIQSIQNLSDLKAIEIQQKSVTTIRNRNDWINTSIQLTSIE